jgi:hypothetical protein
MPSNIKKKIQTNNQTRSYVAKDFLALKSDLLEYAKTYFPDKIQDFGETSIGGLFLDMAAMVGDTMTFYLDHQFMEMNPSAAVEVDNIRTHLANAGVKLGSSSPSSVTVTISVTVSAEKLSSGDYQPKNSILPLIGEGTEMLSSTGPTFTTIEDIDFSKKSNSGELLANITIADTDASGNPTYYSLSRDVVCVSGMRSLHSQSFENMHVPFREMELPEEDVTDIISVKDSEGNTYYEVNDLSQDTVYTGISNLSNDNELVEQNLEIVVATHRFIKMLNPSTRLTKIRFGSGNADAVDDDIIPDPSELSLPLYGKKTFPRFSIDPNSLLNTKTLGVSPRNTTVRVVYRHGGGSIHNVGAHTILEVSSLKLTFPGNPSDMEALIVRSSIGVDNSSQATGGAPPPTLTELKAAIPQYRQMQSRIVSKEDLLARIYTLPSKFGRVFRAGIKSNPNNPLASQLFLLCMNSQSRLVPASDSLKKNIRIYLNEFRLISDAIDVLDVRIINLSVKFAIITGPDENKDVVLQRAIVRLQAALQTPHAQIDKSIIYSDLTNIIINTPGVISLTDLRVENLRGTIGERDYSDISFNVDASTYKGLIIPPPGSIFELRYPNNDIIGSAI